MKRRTILAVIILSFSLAAGCGGDSKSSQSLSSENAGSQDPGSSASASVSEEIIADRTEVELLGWFGLMDIQQEYITEESKTYNLAYNQFSSSDWMFWVVDSRAVGQ